MLQVSGTVYAPGFNVPLPDPGPLVQTTPGAGAGARYGIGQFANGTTRVYAGTSNANASVSLALARPDGGFDDVIKVTADGKAQVTGAVTVANTVTANFFKGDGAQLTNLPVPTMLRYTNVRISDASAGTYKEVRITFATPLPNANYHVQITPYQNVGQVDNGVMKPVLAYVRRKTTTYLDIMGYAPDAHDTFSTNNVYADVLVMY